LAEVFKAHSRAIFVFPHPAGPFKTPTLISSSASSSATSFCAMFLLLLGYFVSKPSRQS